MKLVAGLVAAALSASLLVDDAARYEPAMTAEVRPLANGQMLADMNFNEAAPVYIFRRSAVTRDTQQSWRVGQWQVETPGVELRRIGLYDALVRSDARPLKGKVRIRFTPHRGLLIADYANALHLTDGTLAIFSDHFALRPAPSIEAVAALGADINALPDYEGGNPLVTFRAAGSAMSHRGERHETLRLETPAYVLFGPAKPRNGEHIATVIDPGLPGWLASQLEVGVPAIMNIYAERLGARKGEKPELIVAWNGPTEGRVSLGGSVLGDTIVMQIEGQALTRPTRSAYVYARQFIAHEAAHFWLGNTVGYGEPGEAWTTEGGADLMAQRAAEIIDPDHDSLPTIDRAFNDCAILSADGPLKTAPERHGQEIFYACGAIFSLAAEAVENQNGGDLFSFWSRLIEANREDGTVTVAEWLDAMRGAGASAEAVRIIAAMHEVGSDDPKASLLALMEEVGVEAWQEGDGRIHLR
ncbi:hypothetical protein [Sphingomicrobium flavum]|uniref:hypothetical protein n=1 Tax=Sphingomicrobium flavum TaxID=1229164 RepID=UPI0021AE0EA3|nr:hypothetical protein [Sphingomicrobium flavum]